MTEQLGQDELVAALDGLLRAAHTRLDASHVAYRRAVADAVKQRGVTVDDQSTSPFGAPVRASALWLDPDSPLRAEWRETDGWTMHGIPSADGVIPAPLEIVAEPDAVADWIAGTLTGSPTSEQPARSRVATSRDLLTPQDLAFEEALTSYHREGTYALLPVPPSAQSRPSKMAWNAALKHRCLSCPPGDGRRTWARREAANFALAAISARTTTVYTGWCLTCHPDPVHMRDVDFEPLDNKVVSAHKRGRFQGSLLVGTPQKVICPVCMAPWLLYPEASLPQPYGLLEEAGLSFHPCPWCWAVDEPRARGEQEEALTWLW